MFRPYLILALALGHVADPAMAAQPTRIRGTIASIDGDLMRVAPNGGGGERVIRLAAKLTISAVVPSSLAAIQPGSFIGTAAETQADGTLVAKEVHVFPEAMRGAGEGHYAFDLGPKSTMTNGTVGQQVTATSGNALSVKYRGGESSINVPPGVPIVTFEPGDRAELVPGAHVIVFAQKGDDDMLSAERVAVGKDGLTPPM